MAGPNGEYNDSDYEFPLPDVPGLPRPSTANYTPQNVAPLIEGLAGHVPTTTSASPFGVAFRYENNSPTNRGDDIQVQHPQDRDYLDAYLNDINNGSPEQERYEQAARQSDRLRTFEQTSPAKIDYFQT